jgi:hypothetical protein
MMLGAGGQSMPLEVFVFLGVAFVLVVFVLWWSRRGGSEDDSPIPPAGVDRPEPSISSESSLGPHRNVGRPWRAEPGDPGSEQR